MKSNSNKRILVTGGLGNLGSWISEEFHQKGYEVYVGTRLGAGLSHPYHELVFDLTDEESLHIITNMNFDYVIHLASYNEFFEKDYFSKALKINTEGTYNLIQRLKGTSIKGFVYFSTVHVYGSLSGVINEQTRPNPLNDYAATHLFAEYIVQQYCTNFHIPYTTFRLSNAYGCPKFSNNTKWYLALNDFCKQAYETRKIVLNTNGEVYRDFIWMGDVAKSVSKLIENSKLQNKTYNLASGKVTKLIDLANIVKSEFSRLFNEEIVIEINSEDKSNYPECEIRNTLLMEDLQLTFGEKMESEVAKIFRYLDQN